MNKIILEQIRQYFNYGDGRDRDLANEIEKLIIQEKIDLLKTITNGDDRYDTTIYVAGLGLENTIKDLKKKKLGI